MYLNIQKEPDGPAKFKTGDKVRVLGYGPALVIQTHWNAAETNPQRRPCWQYVVRFETGRAKLKVDERDLEPR